jgi:hypothetical protein
MKKLFFTCVFIALNFAWINGSFGQSPRTLQYQGNLKNSGAPVNGTRNLTFTLYDAVTGGTTLWTEIHNNVTISNGDFNVILGSITALNIQFNQHLWMGIKVDATPEISPRVEISGSTYALGLSLPIKAISTDTTGGVKVTISNVLAKSPALWGITNSNLAGSVPVYGLNTGSGDAAGTFRISNPASTFSALYGETNGTGAAVYGNNIGLGRAGSFQNTNVTNAQPAIQGVTLGTGMAAWLSINNAANDSNQFKDKRYRNCGILQDNQCC